MARGNDYGNGNGYGYGYEDNRYDYAEDRAGAVGATVGVGGRVAARVPMDSAASDSSGKAPKRRAARGGESALRTVRSVRSGLLAFGFDHCGADRSTMAANFDSTRAANFDSSGSLPLHANAGVNKEYNEWIDAEKVCVWLVCMLVWAFVCVGVCSYVCVCMFVCMCVCMCVYVGMYACMFVVCLYVRVYVR